MADTTLEEHLFGQAAIVLSELRAARELATSLGRDPKLVTPHYLQMLRCLYLDEPLGTPTPPAEGEVAELAANLRMLAPHNPLGTADPTITRAADLLLQQEARIAELDQKLEIERMRVVACGAVAMADTPSSAAKARACHPDYWSASADDIARQIDELMRLSAQQKPVPVSEGWPGDQLCWWYEPDEDDGYGGGWTLLRIRGGTGAYTYWLPAHALPLPQGEAQQ